MTATKENAINAHITIKDVARAAEVGVVTVSRALNDQPGVSDATRQRIRAVAEELGYRPNRHARFLELGSQRSIAVMMKGIDNPFFQQMMDSMESAAREQKYLLNVVKVPHWADEIEEAIRLVDEDAMSGIIFLGGNFTHEPEVFDRIRAPFVMSTIGRLVDVSEDAYSSVSVDDFAEAQRVVEYLIGLGHTRIALLGAGIDDVSVGRLRAEGYRAALTDAGIEVDETLIRSVDFGAQSPYSFEYGHRATTELVAAHPEVTAIVAVADVIAIGALKALADLGIAVPEQVSVIGFDGIPMARYVTPTLSTLRQPAAQIASLTTQILFEVMDGRPARHELLTGELVIGDSTAPPRPDDSSRAS